jgi:hypothetical protein
VRPFGLSNRAFNSYVIYFSVVVLTLSFGIEIGVIWHCDDCAMGGESIGLLQRLLDLWRRWWR